MSCTILTTHAHLACLPLTSKEGRSVRLARKLRPDWTEREAIEFVRTFAWHITRAPGGVEGLLR